MLSSVMKLMREKRLPWPASVENKGVSRLRAELGPADVAVTFVNHATFLIQLPGLNILTDPIWSKRASPFQWIGPARVRKPGVPLDDLPKIDLVLLSHNHYDHLDRNTLKILNEKFSPTVLAPVGNRKLVESIGFRTVHEFDWWEEIQMNSGLKITFTPAQHFSARTPWNRQKSLWGGYMIQHQGRRIYFGGDSGYSSHFAEIGKRLGSPDLAFLGIGAYEPRWFMKPMHMNPAEAVQAHLDLGSKRSIGMHFGTFHLSAETIDQPKADLASAALKANLSEDKFITLLEGETRVF